MGLDGAPKGLVVDFWEAWSATTGIEITLVQATWAETLKMMREGTADIHGGLYFTEDRDGFLDYSTPFFSQKATLFVRASLGIDDVKKLKGCCVAVLDQGYSHYWLARNHPEMICMPYKTSRDMIEAALSGEVEALLAEYTTLVYQLGATGQYKNFIPLAAMYERSMMGAVAHGRPDLLKVVNQGIRKMGEEGREKVFERWIIPENSLPGWLWPAAGVGLVALIASLAAVVTSGYRPK